MEKKLLETDVLIIGGGSAGMWTANHFKDLQPDKEVLIVDKGPKDWGGLMTMAPRRVTFFCCSCSTSVRTIISPPRPFNCAGYNFTWGSPR